MHWATFPRPQRRTCTRQRSSRLGGDAGKLADPALDVPEPDAKWRPPARLAQFVPSGALYTGRGPVCGTIMRGDGACGRGGAIGVAGFVATGVAGCGGAGAGGIAGVGVAAWAAGGTIGGCAGGATGGVVAAVAGGCADGGAGTVNVGLGAVVGTTILGGGTAAAGGGGGVFTGEAGGAAGVALTGGRAAGADAATGACCLRIAFRTSPGREILR